MRALIIDDDSKSSLPLRRLLEQETFAVDRARNVTHGAYLARITGYDVILLHETGPINFSLQTCIRIRESGRTDAIMVLTYRNDSQHRSSLLNAGADDCVSVPYCMAEVISRIRAILRRGKALKAEVFQAGSIVLNSRKFRVECNGKPVSLSKKEFALLEVLMRNKGGVVSRMTLLERVWNMDVDILTNTVEAHISSLRMKLGKSAARAIRNVQGRGYIIDED